MVNCGRFRKAKIASIREEKEFASTSPLEGRRRDDLTNLLAFLSRLKRRHPDIPYPMRNRGRRSSISNLQKFSIPTRENGRPMTGG